MWVVYNLGYTKITRRAIRLRERSGEEGRVGVVEKWYARRRDDAPVSELSRSLPEWRAALAFPYPEYRFTSSTEEQIAARFFAMGWISGCTGTSSTMRVGAHSVRFTHTSS